VAHLDRLHLGLSVGAVGGVMEWRILLCALLGAAGWWLGGRGVWPGKAWRRFIAPALIGVVLLGVFPGWRLALGVVLMMFANSMGYGEASSWWKRLLTFVCLGACLLPFGLAWWQAAIVPTWFGGNFLLSRMSNRHGWVFVEATTGAIQGALAGMAT